MKKPTTISQPAARHTGNFIKEVLLKVVEWPLNHL